jgi:phosphatidylethanolamine/phosphatidyl-N-methylethanolamine N-methyltransferase
LDQNSIIKSYKRVSSFYDYTFGKVFKPGQRALIEKMSCDDSDIVLEIGIGTGASFQFYPDKTNVIGIDISPDMLDLAKEKIKNNKIENKYISMMNGEHLSFPDNTFDKVVAMHVMSVTQNPKSLVDEMKRVCKDDGDIYIVNHFSSESDKFWLKALEKGLMPISKILGWKPYFPFSEFNNYANLNVQEVSKVNIFNYWNIIHATNNK